MHIFIELFINFTVKYDKSAALQFFRKSLLISYTDRRLFHFLSKNALIDPENLSKNFGRKLFKRLQNNYKWCIIAIKW